MTKTDNFTDIKPKNRVIRYFHNGHEHIRGVFGLQGRLPGMKRFAVLLFAAVLVFSFSARAAGNGEHVSFTVNGTHTNTDMNYTNDALYAFMADKFDFDFRVEPVSKDGQSERIRMWINSRAMPDVVTWRSFAYQEYVDFARAGLLAPLPEDWTTRYPNLYEQMIGCMGEEQFRKFEIDGRFYGIAHARNYRYNPVDTPVDHVSVYYRKDWATALGMDIGPVITIDELETYLRLCLERDFAGNGSTIGFSEDPNRLATFFCMQADVDWQKFYKAENGYAWGFANETVRDAAALANRWYREGLIDPDFYLQQSAETIANFTTGQSAAMFGNCQASSYLGYKQSFDEATGLDSDTCVGITTIAGTDGVTRAIETLNWWSVSLFSPETEPEVLDRILSAMDYCATQEGEIVTNMGIPGKDWEYDGAGNVQILMPQKEDGSYPNIVDLYNSYNVFRTWGLNADDFLYVNPTYDKAIIIDPILDFYRFRPEGKVIPLDVDYEFFSSENKARYSLALEDEFARLVIGDAETLEQDWLDYIESEQKIWQPVIDDLNAAFFGG